MTLNAQTGSIMSRYSNVSGLCSHYKEAFLLVDFHGFKHTHIHKHTWHVRVYTATVRGDHSCRTLLGTPPSTVGCTRSKPVNWGLSTWSRRWPQTAGLWGVIMHDSWWTHRQHTVFCICVTFYIQKIQLKQHLSNLQLYTMRCWIYFIYYRILSKYWDLYSLTCKTSCLWSPEASRAPYSYLEFSKRFEIWHAALQLRCQATGQISQWLNDFETKSRILEISRDLRIKRFAA